VLFGALSTVDPGDLFETYAALDRASISVSAISLSAQMHVLHKATQITQGLFDVAMNEDHFRELLFRYLRPPASNQGHTPSPTVIGMGFPGMQANSTTDCLTEKQHFPTEVLCQW
jgi:transcription initiation factor TFIIH subunit 2